MYDELDHVEDGGTSQGLVIWRLMKEDDKRRALTSHVAPLEHQRWGWFGSGSEEELLVNANQSHGGEQQTGICSRLGMNFGFDSRE